MKGKTRVVAVPPLGTERTETKEGDSSLAGRLLDGLCRIFEWRIRNVQSPVFPCAPENIPEGQEGIEWILKNREKVFPWVNREIQFDNDGAPSASEFYYEAVRQYGERAKSGYGRMKENHEMVEGARIEVAKLLSCDPSEIAFVQNTSVGINIVAQGIDWQPGDEIIVTRGDQEYPTNYSPWKAVAERFERQRTTIKQKYGVEVPGIKIVEVGDEEGVVKPEDIERALSPKTRLVTISSMGWKNGYHFDLEGIGAALQRHNAQKKDRRILFHVDGIQSVGAKALDVKKSRIDFLSAGSSKWMLADGGNGIFYSGKDALKELPNAPIGADSLKDWKDAESGLQEGTARVFETGKPNEQGICGLRAAMALINRIGIKNIEQRIRELTLYLEEKLVPKGYLIVSPHGNAQEKTGMVVFSTPRLEDEKNVEARGEMCSNEIGPLMKWNALMDPDVKSATMQEKGIGVSVRDGRIRASIHYYNTREEIDELIRRLPDLKTEGVPFT